MTKTAAIQELSRLTAQVYAYHKSGQITDDELAKAQHHINTAADELARGIDPDLAMISTGTIYDLLRKAETRKPAKEPDAPAKKTGAKKASAGMTQEDYDRLYDFVYTKKEKGVITDNETSSFLRFLDELKNGGASAAEAEKALETSIRSLWADGKSAPDAIKAAKSELKTSAPQGKKTAMTAEELNQITLQLREQWKAGQITWEALNDSVGKASAAYRAGKTFAEGRAAAGLKSGTPKSDPGERATDKAVSDLEKQLRKVYNSAKTELTGELKQLEKEYAKELKDKRKKLDDGEISQSEYDAWVRGQLMRQERMKQQIDQCTGTLLNANEKAIAMVNGERLGVFAENANYQSYQINKQADMNLMFSVYDETTAARLIRDNPDLLPPRKVNEKKDRKWNQQRITAAVAQAVIQGDSIPKLAARIAGDAAGANASAMLRYARTAMTGAQNAGRQEMLQQAAAMGIKVKKRWLATLDARTRDSHASMDGETVDIDKRFSNGLMFPGDPNGKPGEVYNCRCTMIYEYDGFKDKAEEALRRDNETGELIRDMTYSEWKKLNAPAPEKPKKTKLEKKIEKATAKAVDKLSEDTREAIEMYTFGEEFHLNQAQFDEIKDVMEETTQTLYRVETSARTAEDNDLDVGDEFDFSQQVFESKDKEDGALRSFTRSEDALPDLLDQTDDAVIYRTHGPVDQLPVDSLSQYEQAESLAFGNGWKVTGHDTITINGKEYQVIDIQQARPEAAKAADDFDEIMAKAHAMKQSDISEWEDDKKNLLPLADEKLSDQAHRIYMSMSAEEERKRTQAVTLKISDLKTEQEEVFIERIEELAEAFNGRPVTGLQTDEHDGITVAKWRGEYIVLDGNNRTNLAILKGQTELDVMLIDFDDDSELKAQIEEIVRRSPVEGKDITDSWERRPDDYAFEIEDVIGAQGFDGLPKIVDPDEFDKAVKASGFIAQRTYSAPDQETLDAYQDMLYNGKFYVDCGTGGAQYGQGMYCAADYTGKLTRGITEEMDHYASLGKKRALTERLQKIEQEVTYDEIKATPYGRDVPAEVFDVWKKLKASGETIYKAKAAGIITQEEYEIWERATADFSQRNKDDPYRGKWGSIASAVDHLKDEEEERFPGYSYTETFTLAPGAKFITYAEAKRLHEKASSTDKPRMEYLDAQSKAFDKYGIPEKDRDDYDRMLYYWRGAQAFKKEKEALAAKHGVDDEKIIEIFSYAQKVMYGTEHVPEDIGAFAATLGYDAINAEGHGQSGSYTVILNRSKCIFRRDKR